VHNYLAFLSKESVNVHAEANTPQGGANMENITYKVYLNEDDKAVYAGDVTAPSYQAAKDFMISEGYEEKDFILLKADH
jgi:hypothetical protein